MNNLQNKRKDTDKQLAIGCAWFILVTLVALLLSFVVYPYLGVQ